MITVTVRDHYRVAAHIVGRHRGNWVAGEERIDGHRLGTVVQQITRMSEKSQCDSHQLASP